MRAAGRVNPNMKPLSKPLLEAKSRVALTKMPKTTKTSFLRLRGNDGPS